MTALLGKAGKKLFARHLEQYAPQDGLYEFHTDEKGKNQRRQRPLPPGLSKRDARILKSVRRRAHYLDKGFSFCGFRCGWTFFIGLIPVVGDLTNISLNYLLVVRKSKQADLPPWLVKRMHVNNSLSALVGFVPFVGDLIVAIYKVNTRNAALLEEFLRIRGEDYLKLHVDADGQVALTSGTSDANARKRGVTKKDAEQVKPGSGLKQGEVVSKVPVNPDLIDEGGNQQVAPSSTMPGEFPVVERSTKGKERDMAGSSQGKPRRGFSLFSNGKKASTSHEDHGRFIENIDIDDVPQKET